jgi:hypothetical protein
VIHSRNFGRFLFVSACVLAPLLATSCGSKVAGRDDQGERISFVHVTDPHLYLYLEPSQKLDPGKPPMPKAMDGSDPADIWQFQQNQDDNAFQDFFKSLGSLPRPEGTPKFVVITGDFGVDPCLILRDDAIVADPKSPTPKECLGDNLNKAKKDVSVNKFVQHFAESPVRDIYFVAGNNDLPQESATDTALSYFNSFFEEVQTKLSAKNANVRLHNLTGCYASSGGAISECSADIMGTPYRLIGFPSQSFKNRETNNSYEDNHSLQSAQFATFKGLLDRAVKDGKKIIIVTHIPEMDDPFLQARRNYAGVRPPKSENKDKVKDNPRSVDSTWNVEKTVLDDWMKVLQSDSVVVVLAGHLHDNHKEIYHRPYAWSNLKDHQLGYRKLFLAPPLSIKSQDVSPIQARGFSVVSVGPDRVTNRFYWYDGLTRAFNPEPSTEIADHHRPRWLARVFGAVNWVWELNHSDGPLERAAVLLIALLAAFLTVVAVWQIPPSDDPIAKKPDDDKKPDSKDNSKTASDYSPFTSRLGKTVVAGLGGLVVAEITKTLGNQQPSPDSRWYYIVCFILFFFLQLFAMNLVRAFAEAIRSRVAVIHYPLARRGNPPRNTGETVGSSAQSQWWTRSVTWFTSLFWRVVDWVSYWFLRFANWLFSLKIPVLTFFDTFINLTQGKNQTMTSALAEVVVDQQKNLIRVADAIRKNLNDLIESRIKGIPDRGTLPHVRVNISALSKDQTTLFYIASAPGSAVLPFTKRSVAWVSVFTGQIRWWVSSYQAEAERILLFDNSKGTIAGAEERILLSNYFQDRSGGGYGSFIVIPLPWPQRSYGSKYVKGAIHISFRDEVDTYNIWRQVEMVPRSLDAKTNLLTYAEPHRMLEDWCEHPDVRAALQTAVLALGELLFGFNEIIFWNYIEPRQKSGA